jgi:hypothetical protein
MPSLSGSLKELYRWNNSNVFKMTYMGVPAFEDGGWSAVEVQAILPATIARIS